MNTIRVNTRHSYDVLISHGLIAEAGDLIYKKLFNGKDSSTVKVLIVLNSDLAVYAAPFIESVRSQEFDTYVLEVPIGEESKDYKSAGVVLDFLVKNDFSREDVVVSFGGGSVGDVVGFIASIYKRGMKLVHVPTTVLAMIDSSIGGKTALNYMGAANLVGSFYQPDLVIDDIDLLATIGGRNLRSGVGELIKYGVLDKSIFYKLYGTVTVKNVENLIGDCVRLKADYVERDELDKDYGNLLNIGHTIANAIEMLSNYKTPHGLAVASGILCVAQCMDAAYHTDVAAKIKRVMDIQGILAEIPYSIESILSAVKKDKLWAYGKLKMVVFDDIGACRVQMFSPPELETFLRGGLYLNS